MATATTTATNKKIYFNSKQIEFFKAKAKVKVAVCGRGFGKSNLPAKEIIDWVKKMPKARCLYVALTYEQIDESFGEVLKRWDAMGMKEGIHYVVGKTPPPWFDTPYKVPKEYGRTVTFYNGFTIIQKSLRDAKTKRGGSYDCAIVEEAAFIKESVFDNIVEAALRGNAGYYHPSVHRSLLVLTSRPTDENRDGRWIYRFRDLHKAYPDEYFYMEAGAIHNMHALGGEKWLEEKKRSMGALRFAIEIENIEIAQSETAFYHLFNREKNTYVPEKVGNNYVDIIPHQLLEMSWDFGGWFTGCLIFQENVKDKTDKMLRRYYVKEKGTWKDVVKQFVNDNVGHQYKYVRLWGDPSGFKKSESEPINLYDSIQRELAKHGWASEVKAWNDPSYVKLSYMARHEFMNSWFANNYPSLPRPLINSECEDTIISIETSERLADGSLNKSLEKDRTYPQELATHQANMYDYYVFCKYSSRVMGGQKRAGRVD